MVRTRVRPCLIKTIHTRARVAFVSPSPQHLCTSSYIFTRCCRRGVARLYTIICQNILTTCQEQRYYFKTTQLHINYIEKSICARAPTQTHCGLLICPSNVNQECIALIKKRNPILLVMFLALCIINGRISFFYL